MSVPIQLKRGKKATFDAMAIKGELLPGEPLYFTDTKEFAVSSSTNSYESVMLERPIFIANGANDAAVNTDIIFSTLYLNRGSGYNASTGVFTAPKAGVYTFFSNVTLDFPIANGEYRLHFYLNGVIVPGTYFIFQKSSAAYISLQANVVIELALGDQISTRLGSAAEATPIASSSVLGRFEGFMVD